MRISFWGEKSFNDYDFLVKTVKSYCYINQVSEIVIGSEYALVELSEKFAEEFNKDKFRFKSQNILGLSSYENNDSINAIFNSRLAFIFTNGLNDEINDLISYAKDSKVKAIVKSFY